MTTFFSDKGKLTLPITKHSPSKKYLPVKMGQPLCVEIIHMSFGNIKDWWGKSEILVSSWAKAGGTPLPGVRQINLMRNSINPLEHLSDFGASEYGHPLVYYSPAYNGKTLRFTLELLEIDKLDDKSIAKLGKSLQSLGPLPIFAPQLSFLALAPEILSIGKRLYEVFNRNDIFLFENLDLSYDDPSSNILSSGRYVLVKGNQNAKQFIESYELHEDNRLRTREGIPAEDSGFTSPYIVIRINAIEKSEYKNFENYRASQEIIEQFINQGITQNIANILTENITLANQWLAFKKALELKIDLSKATLPSEKNKLIDKIEEELKLISLEQVQLLEIIFDR